ncbi:MAG: hypothetical protein JNN15_04040 [Blastocatellia bacterium]|nr:hypothetical protein [Blastocatellia bacterium]
MSARPARLRFDAISQIEKADGCYQIVAHLSYKGRELTGYSELSGLNRDLEAAATAVLKAVEEFVRNRVECQLIELDRISALGKELIVLLVRVRFNGKEVQIFGSCKASEDLLESSARAALDATNRYVELALAEKEETTTSTRK